MMAIFTAHMVMGHGAWGNGVLHNNLNVLSTSTANPNLYQNHVGRIDTDRSYLTRIWMNYKWSDRLNTSFQLKYRDGQSFTAWFADPYQNDQGRQIAFTQEAIKGDNPFTGIMGSREDFFMDIQIKINYAFPLKDNRRLECYIHGYNLMDFANNILEYNFAWRGEFNRFALDLAVPRGFKLGVAYKY